MAITLLKLSHYADTGISKSHSVEYPETAVERRSYNSSSSLRATKRDIVLEQAYVEKY